MALTMSVELSSRDRRELERWVRSPSMRAGLAQRARIVLLAADGLGTNDIVERVGVSRPTVTAWRKRFAEHGVTGLDDIPKPGRPRTVDEVLVLQATLEPPPSRG